MSMESPHKDYKTVYTHKSHSLCSEDPLKIGMPHGGRRGDGVFASSIDHLQGKVCWQRQRES